MPVLKTVGHFEIPQANVVLWTFRGPYGPTSEDPRYTGRWVDATDDVDKVLRTTLQMEVERIEEVKDYGLLEENHESSALRISVDETHAGYILEECAAEIQEKKSSKLRHIQNSTFYVAKYSWEDSVLYAVRKTDASWKTKRALNFQTVLFQDG